MAETFRSDGKAVDVVVSVDVEKGDPVYAEGFKGIAMTDASSGDEVALEIALREHEIQIGELTGAKGDVLYITEAGALTNDSGDIPFAKVTLAKDANGFVWAVLLPQV